MRAFPTDVIRRAPKVLLHDHLDGGLRPATIVELAAFHPKSPELVAKAPFDAERVRPHARAARLREFANTYLQLVRSKLQLEILE